MAQNIIKHVKDMVAEANREIETIPVVDASKYFKDSQYVFVDISCLLYTSPSPRDATLSRMPSSA